MRGAFKALQKLHADERDDLRLASGFERGFLFVMEVGEWVVDREGEERLGFAECLFDAFVEAAIGGFEIVAPAMPGLRK